MSDPLVSVIIPAYNCERFIEESIKSIFAQSFTNFELIVINDGSTDSTSKVIKKMVQNAPEWLINDFIFIDRKTNKGCFRSRRQGMELSRAKYVALLDADDIAIINRFEKQIRMLENNPEIWCIGGHAIKIFSNGEEGKMWDYPPENHEDIVKMITKECKNPMIDPTIMFRRNVFDEIGGYSWRYKYLAADMELWLRSILKNKKLYNIQEPLIKYRINTEGLTIQNRKNMIKQHMRIWRKFMKQYRKMS